jgi:hypothetical protein
MTVKKQSVITYLPRDERNSEASGTAGAGFYILDGIEHKCRSSPPRTPRSGLPLLPILLEAGAQLRALWDSNLLRFTSSIQTWIPALVRYTSPARRARPICRLSWESSRDCPPIYRHRAGSRYACSEDAAFLSQAARDELGFRSFP